MSDRLNRMLEQEKQKARTRITLEAVRNAAKKFDLICNGMDDQTRAAYAKELKEDLEDVEMFLMGE